MGITSGFHWILIAAVLLLLFGNRLPSVMRSLGQGVVEFKKGLAGIEDELNKPSNTDSQAKPQVKEEAKTTEV